MPQLDNSLPPGLAGFMATRQANQQADQGNLANITGITGILAKLQAAQREQELRDALASGDTARLAKLPGGLAILQKMATMKNADITGQLHQAQIGEITRKSGIANQEQRAKGELANLLSGSGSFGQGTDAERPNAQVFTNDAEAIAAMRTAEAAGRPFTGNVPNPGNVRALTLAAGNAIPRGASAELLKQLGPQANKPSAVGKLIAERDALPPNDPNRMLYDAAIDKASTHQPAVNVYSGSLTAGVDAEGKPIFVQPSGRPDVLPRQVPGVFPPPAPGEKKAAEKVAETEATIQSVRQRVNRMSELIQGNTGVVGPAGIVRRLGETAIGTVAPNIPTPAIDLENEKNLMVADVRKLIEKDPNLSNQERETLSTTLGGGTMQTPGSAIRTLNNVLSFIEGKKLTGGSRKRRASDAAPATNAKGWKLMIDAKGNKAYVGPNNEIEEVK